jgi:hypothetical protein
MSTSYLSKLKYSLPWLVRYPLAQAKSFLKGAQDRKKHLVFIIANHFEPSWKKQGGHDIETQLRRLDDWHRMARVIGGAVRDTDGTKFRHTNFYPGEQYDHRILERLAAMQSEGLGEVEIHLHHGVEAPDTPANLRQTLLEFRDRLAEDHKCLSRFDGAGDPVYAFIHGNLALANSYDGRFCGVDGEMQILQETGCYADMTLPNAPHPTQVPVINKIYECGLPLTEKIPHRKGKSVAVNGNHPQLPLIFTGPLVFNWTRRFKGIPVPRIDDGALSRNQPMSLARLRRWQNANITVEGHPEWVFIKLYCHGFFDYDQSACIGENARRFFSEVIENGERTNEYDVHFASAREAFNLVAAAIDGKTGDPNEFRDYRLRAIMNAPDSAAKSRKTLSANW